MTVHEPTTPPIPVDTFALRLVIVRHDRGHLSQKEAAERCGLDDGSWSNWENGTQPRGLAAVVAKISDGLDVDRDWLMWGGPLYQGASSLRWIAMLSDDVPQDCVGQLELLSPAA